VAIDALAPAGAKNTKRLPSSILLLSDGRTTTGRDPVEVARTAKTLHIPIYTVSVGTEDALIPNPGFGPPLPVPPDPDTLRRISSITHGEFFGAPSATALKAAYRTIGARVGTTPKRVEVSGAFLAVGAVLLVGAGALSTLWSSRVP
jgi:Ca-activated chloride channel family protein